MSSDLLKSYVEKLHRAVPDGSTIPYAEALEKAGDDKAWLKALVFGLPKTISRVQSTFTLRAEEAADMPPLLPGFTVHSDKEVTFTLTVEGDRAKATNIAGIRVEIPVMGSFPLTNAWIRIDNDGLILVSTKKLMVVITVVLDQSGNYLHFRLGP